MDKKNSILIKITSFTFIAVSISIGSILITQNINKNTNDKSQNIELWNGIKYGMNTKEVISVLGGDTSCRQETDWFDKPIAGEFACWRKDPKVSIANEKGMVGVRLEKEMVTSTWITFNLQSKCLENNETTSWGDQNKPCFKALERRIYASIENAKKILTNKYGEMVQVESLFNDEKIYYGWISDRKIIRIRRPDIGIWTIYYSVNKSPV